MPKSKHRHQHYAARREARTPCEVCGSPAAVKRKCPDYPGVFHRLCRDCQSGHPDVTR